MMRKLFICCFSIISVLLFTPNILLAGVLSADLQQILQHAHRNDEIDIIIRFEGKVDVESIAANNNSNNRANSASKNHKKKIKQKRKELINALKQMTNLSQKEVKRLLRRADIKGRAHEVVTLWAINGLAMKVKADVIPKLLTQPQVQSIQLDSVMKAPAAQAAVAATPEWNVSAVNAPDLWQLGFTGQGTVIAIVDTGVDINHPDLAPAWRGGNNSWFDPHGNTPLRQPIVTVMVLKC